MHEDPHSDLIGADSGLIDPHFDLIDRDSAVIPQAFFHPPVSINERRSDMDTIVRRRSLSFEQVLTFVMAHLDIFSATAVGMKVVADLQRYVAKLATLFVTESDNRTAAHDHTVTCRAARLAVRRAWMAIRRTSLLLALDSATTA